MLPNGVAGLLFLVAALSPGLLYHRAVMRYVPRDARSTVVEVVEVVELATVGVLTSVLACVVVLAVLALVVSLGLRRWPVGCG